MSQPVGPLVEDLFRREAGRLTARLARLLGPGSLDMAEELVQSALTKALAVWPFRGVPDNPAGWLWTAARNAAIDALRQRRFTAPVSADDLAEALADEAAADPAFAGELADDQLRLIFACCHPALPADARVALTLKTVGGFGVAEIARAFLMPEPTIAQRLVRAKAKLAEARIPFAIPGPDELPARQEAVLEVVYLLFNEGYGAARGDLLVRHDLAREAIRLADMLASGPVTGTPEARALAALLCLQGARLASRVDADGTLRPLAEQDRTAWDKGMIGQGFRWLQSSLRGGHETRWHIEAAIAASHAAAPSFQETDWERILRHYDRLMAVAPSPVVALNRAVAVAEVDGPRAALDSVEDVVLDPRLARYPLLAAIRAELHRRLGDTATARTHLAHALSMELSGPERRFLQRKMLEL
ncbi:MAG TPA: sigma-70 family RNA polymerase sigma factor [Azospirillaceae bacterium]|nr:sigma-70 family RNA polymerase sigma factor [Azospirillaceae bacterium]